MNSPSPCPRVLMVDVGGSCEDIERYLSDSGVTVLTESNSEQALQTAKSEDVDVILTDMSVLMPSGKTLVEVLCSLSPSKAVIVVGSLSQEDAVSLLGLGVISYFKRPLDLPDLMLAIKHVSASKNKANLKISDAANLVDERHFEFTSLELSKADLRFETVNLLRSAGLIAENERLRYELVFQEALANALEHGNLELESPWKEEIDETGRDRYTRTKAARLEDPKFSNRKISIWMGFTNKKLYLRIKDDGKGFTNKACLTPDAEELACHGRGITIMNAAMDHVEYLSNGSEIYMYKLIGEDSNGA
ncbi:MAG: ATP-binding protein [Bdellovibrionales bacterium]|nr:ATP-binding protein [Bdellovibrionales bacterium]